MENTCKRCSELDTDLRDYKIFRALLNQSASGHSFIQDDVTFNNFSAARFSTVADAQRGAIGYLIEKYFKIIPY